MPLRPAMVKQFRTLDAKIHSVAHNTMADPDSNSNEPVRAAIRVQTEDIAFARDELITCDRCARQNPPNRLECLYCGHGLAVDAGRMELMRPAPRPLESWETGFSVIVRTTLSEAVSDMDAVSVVTGLGVSELRAIASAERPMPVAMLGSENEADIMVAALNKLGVDAFVITDESLVPEQPSVRLRGIEFEDAAVTLIEFNSGNRINISQEDLILIVAGTISESRTDQIEKKRRGKQTKVLDHVETEQDEAVVDIYVRGDAIGFRVMLAGFDFSCLGKDKSYIAAENIRRLVTALHGLAPHTRVVTYCHKVRHALSPVWTIDVRKDSRGMQRSRFGRSEPGSRIASSNLRQLNRFSRLQRHFL